MAANGVRGAISNGTSGLREPSHAASRRTSADDTLMHSSSSAVANASTAEAGSLLSDRQAPSDEAGSPSRVLQEAQPSRETLIKQLRGIEALLEIKTKEVNKLIDTLKVSPQYDLEEYLEEYNTTCYKVHQLQLQRDRVKLQATLMQQQYDQQQQQQQHYQLNLTGVPLSLAAPVATSAASSAPLLNNGDNIIAQSNQKLPTVNEERFGGSRTSDKISSTLADTMSSTSAVSSVRDYNAQTSTASVVSGASNEAPRTISPRTHRRVTQTSNTAQIALMSSSALPPTSPALPSTNAAVVLSRQQQVSYSSSPPAAVKTDHSAADSTDSGYTGSGNLKHFPPSNSTLLPSSMLMHSTSTSSTTSTATIVSIVPDGFIQVYLPDGQHSRVKIVPGKTLRDVLSTKLNQRCLMPELCHAYKGQPEQSVEGQSTFYTRQPVEWTTDSAQLGCSTITVERDNTKEPTNITEFSFKWRRISHDLDRSSSILDRKPCFVCKSTVFRGFKCRQCKIKVHYECADRMPNICTSEPNPQAIRRLINRGFLAVPVSPGHNQNQFFIDESNPAAGTDNVAASARTVRGGSAVAAASSPTTNVQTDAVNDTPSGTSLRAGRSTSEPDVSRHGVSTTTTLDDRDMAAAAAAAVAGGKADKARYGGGLQPPPATASSGLLAVTPPAAGDAATASTQTTIAMRRKAGTPLAALHTNIPLPTVDGRTAIAIPPRTPATATSLTPSTAGEPSSSTATTPLSGSFLSQHQLGSADITGATTPNLTNKAVRIRVQPQLNLNQQQYLQHKFRQDTDRESMQDWEIPDAEICDRKQVGSGSFGTVYKAKWHGEVALKKLKVANPSKEQLDSFKNEVRVLKRMRHTNIVLFMGCVLHPNLAIVTEWCPGDSLYKKLHVDDQPLDNNQIFSVAEQTILGMEYLHAKNIIHRDLKSNNIFLKENWTVKIGDMGLSIVKTAWTGPGTSRNPSYPFGSVLWMAPEIINPKLIGKDADPYTEKSDVYAFGIVLYELWSGLLPYTGEPKDSIMWGVGRGNMKPDLTKLKNSCPKGMRKLLNDCIQTDREKRPTFQELVKSYADVMELVPRISRSMSDDRLHRASLKLSDYEQNTAQSGRKQQVAPLPAQWHNHFRQYSSHTSTSGTNGNSRSGDDGNAASNGTLTEAESAAVVGFGGNSRSSTPLASTSLPASSAALTDTVDGGQPEIVMPGGGGGGGGSGDATENRFTRAKRLISGKPSNTGLSSLSNERDDSAVSLRLQPLDSSTTASLLALCMQQPTAPKSASPACMPISSSSSSGSSVSSSCASNRSKFFGTTPLSQYSSSTASGRHATTTYGSSSSVASHNPAANGHQTLPDVFVFPPPAPSTITSAPRDADGTSSRRTSIEDAPVPFPDAATASTDSNTASTNTRYMPARNRYLHNARALSEERVVSGTTINFNPPQPRGPYVRRIREEFEPSATPPITTALIQPLSTQRVGASNGETASAAAVSQNSSVNPTRLDNI